MTIESVLELDLRIIADSERRALEVLAQIWERQGRPTERLKLISVLRRTLDVCDQYGYTYPKLFLLRKGELTRREWQPRTYTVAQSGKEKEPGGCSCWDGWLPTGRPCPCPKGEPHRERLRKWGMQV